jgi:anti-sigma factor RsiW
MMKRGASGGGHREISDLIPWYVNGTLDDRRRERVEAHLASCTTCRDELANERRLYQEMAAEPGVEYMPAPSLKRLQAAIDELSSGPVPTLPVAAPPPVIRWRGLAAAAIVGAAAVLALMSAGRFASGARSDYHTVTSAVSRAHDEVIRAVFAPTTPVIDVQRILAEAQLRIVAGPTEAGVYSLASTSSRPVSDSLALIRSHPEVRFAESTQPDGEGARARENP